MVADRVVEDGKLAAVAKEIEERWQSDNFSLRRYYS